MHYGRIYNTIAKQFSFDIDYIIQDGERMKHLEKVYLPYEILEKTTVSLQEYGDRLCEGLVLWLGEINNDKTARVTQMVTPEQKSIKSEDGVGYFVNSQTLFNINKLLSASGLRLLAQVHSHPGRAYHSQADDRYCIVTMEGGFSIVVPNFGFGPTNLLQWATYRLTDGTWKKLSKGTVKTIFQVEEIPGKGNENGSLVLGSIKKILGLH